METSFDHEFARLTSKCRQHIRAGQTDFYSMTLKEMAKLLEQNGRYLDELKILIPSFYIDLSGVGRAPYIDKNVPSMLRTAIINSGIDERQMRDLYSELIYPDLVPKHTMSIGESYYLFRLCVEDKVEQAEYVLSRI